MQKLQIVNVSEKIRFKKEKLKIVNAKPNSKNYELNYE